MAGARAVLLAAALAGCSAGSGTTSRDGAAPDAPAADGPAPDLSAMTTTDGPAKDTDQRSSPAAPDLAIADVPAEPAPDAAVDAVEGGPDVPAADTAPACSPAPDQHGFYGSCSACPSPGDCDTIDVNGSRRYACGCSGGCPCNLHCGSYQIPGAPVTISDICVR
jgi:hypothetical protein